MHNTRSRTKSAPERVPLAMIEMHRNTCEIEIKKRKISPEFTKPIADKKEKHKISSKSLVNNSKTSTKCINKENEEKDSNLDYYQKQVDDLQLILSKKYANVVERLKLEFLPNCIRDMVFCKNNHGKNCPAPKVISNHINYKMNHFLEARRPLNFLKKCNSVMQQGTIINDDVLSSIFQLIITNKSFDGEINYTNDYIVNEAKMTLLNFINIFPPCWKEVRYIYMNFCTNSIEPSKYLSENYHLFERRNMFLFIISMLEKVIYECDEQISASSFNNSTDSSIGDSEMIFNFKEWETKNSKENNMNVLTREEKLNRLFLCLDVFVKMFEVDLSLWFVRNFAKPFRNIFSTNKPLLIGALLIKESKPISDYVLKVINLYLIIFFNNFPIQSTNIFKRLLTLLSVVMNLMDMKENMVGYPKIQTNTLVFTKNLFEAIQATIGLNIEGFLQFLTNVDVPSIRLLLIDKFIKTLDDENSKNSWQTFLTPKIIYEKFSKLYWKNFKKSTTYPINEKIKNKESQDNNFITFPQIKNDLRLPVLDICREDYLFLYLEAIKSYCDAFYTKEFLLILMDCSEKPSIISSRQKKPKKINKKFNLEKLENDYKKMLHKIDLNSSLDDFDLKDFTLPYLVDINSEIILQYREDFKYLSLLKKNLPIMIEKFGSQFEIFTVFIQNCFTPKSNES